jgi:hypothetical protein
VAEENNLEDGKGFRGQGVHNIFYSTQLDKTFFGDTIDDSGSYLISF